MLLLVGLGNPGGKYAENRHNIGFMAVDEIVRRHNFLPERARFQSLIHEGTLDDIKVLIMKPQTYMNESGRAVQEAAKFYKITPENIVVLYDELDVAPGKIKTKRGGGHAGHNGIRSLMTHLGPDFHRVRIGIGHPGDKELVHGHVLSDFAKKDSIWRDPLLDAMADNAAWLAHCDLPRFQSEVARQLSPNRESTGKNNEQNSAAEKSAAVKTVKLSASPTLKKGIEGPMADALKTLIAPKGDK